MATFATTVPLKPGFTATEFRREVARWIRGIRASTVLDADDVPDGGPDDRPLVTDAGEILTALRAGTEAAPAGLGVRHDLPDPQGRLWRTEAVVRWHDGGAVLRVVGRCMARASAAPVLTPRRPHLLRSLIEAGWIERDQGLAVQMQPRLVSGHPDDLLLAAEITEGRAARFLPIVWVSAMAQAEWVLEWDELQRLATDLCGVAHVVVERDRAQSFRLRDLTGGRNVYGGNVGLSVPGEGFVRRFWIGWATPTADTLRDAVQAAALSACTTLPQGAAWEWHDLQAVVLDQARGALWDDDETDALIRLADAEIAEKTETIAQLRADLREAQRKLALAEQEGRGLADRIGAELWQGEFNDRLRALLAHACREASETWDPRSLAVFRRALGLLQPSRGLALTQAMLDRATRDGSFEATLLALGYVEKGRNNHLVMEAREGLEGLGPITLPLTPSDRRSAKNQRSQIEASLGLGRL
jgi:hypothetical protein